MGSARSDYDWACCRRDPPACCRCRCARCPCCHSAPYDCEEMPYEKTDADIRFGRLLKEARDRAGLSSETIAKQLYVERRTVDRWMIGDRRPLTESLVAEYERVCGLESGALVTAYRALPPRGAGPSGSSENVPPGPLGGAAVHPDGGGGDAGPPPSSESGAVVKSLAKRRATRSLPRWATLVVAMMVVWAAAVVGLITTDEEPSPRYADRLSAIWTPLNRARVQGRRQLASARTSSEQAKAAAALGAAFARAAREGALLQVRPGMRRPTTASSARSPKRAPLTRRWRWPRAVATPPPTVAQRLGRNGRGTPRECSRRTARPWLCGHVAAVSKGHD